MRPQQLSRILQHVLQILDFADLLKVFGHAPLFGKNPRGVKVIRCRQALQRVQRTWDQLHCADVRPESLGHQPRIGWKQALTVSSCTITTLEPALSRRFTLADGQFTSVQAGLY